MHNPSLPLIVNFGGPRHLNEIAPFLQALLTDEDVIRTKWPRPIHHWFFSRVAKKRALFIEKDYKLIGGKSPIFQDTETIAANLGKRLKKTPLTFHRYLPSTHPEFLQAIQEKPYTEIRIFPLFPQFSYATTGSIARWFSLHLPEATLQKMQWIPSYAKHPSYIRAMQKVIEEFLKHHQLKEEEVILLFSAHGLPKKFITDGDIYERECTESYEKISALFPKALSRLCYQSKFGRGEWLRPYTNEVCEEILSWNQDRRHCVVIPLSFTSDHIETLFEIEHQYLPLIRNKGLYSYRCPALNHHPLWMEAVEEIFSTSPLASNASLIRS